MVDLTNLSPNEWRSIVDDSKSAIEKLVRNIEQVVEEENPNYIDESILRRALDPGNDQKSPEPSSIDKLSKETIVHRANLSTLSEPKDWGTYTDDEIVSRLIFEADNAITNATIACGEAGFLKRYRKLVDSVIRLSKRKNINIRIYYQNLPKNLKSELEECGCEMIQGNDYPRNHFWIIDDKFAYCHTHPRRQDEFISDPNRISNLKKEFDKLASNSAR